MFIHLFFVPPILHRAAGNLEPIPGDGGATAMQGMTAHTFIHHWQFRDAKHIYSDWWRKQEYHEETNKAWGKQANSIRTPNMLQTLLQEEVQSKHVVNKSTGESLWLQQQFLAGTNLQY